MCPTQSSPGPTYSSRDPWRLASSNHLGVNTILIIDNAASTTSRIMIKLTQGTQVGKTLKDEEASQRGSSAMANSLSTHVDGPNLELPARNAIGHQPCDKSISDDNEILASARESAKRFAHGYTRALLVQYQGKEDTSRPNIWNIWGQQRHSQSTHAQHAAEPSAHSLHHGPNPGCDSAAPEQVEPTGRGKQQQRAPVNNVCREPPMWIDATSSQCTASAGGLSLQQAYARQFEDRPPRLRLILREVRRDARVLAAAKAKAQEDNVQDSVGAEGTEGTES